MIHYTITNFPIGKLLISNSNKGITHILFEYQILQFESIIKKKFPNETIVRDDKSLTQTVLQLKEYFSRERESFNLALDLAMPPFHQKVLDAVKKIPFGKTISYSDIAERAGNIKAARAAGSANANNPIPIIIPCHRVLALGGRLGGYAGGLKIKNYLLNLEGAL
ncbi:MAG: methylated-DNA--[protein]-cysteine S-methyltransferase [Fidelibacterota bacterium]